MSTKAFVLIETAVGKTKEVVAALQKIGGIKSVDAVTGPYDVILVAEQEDLSAVVKLVTTQIHPITGVNRTVSCISFSIH